MTVCIKAKYETWIPHLGLAYSLDLPAKVRATASPTPPDHCLLKSEPSRMTVCCEFNKNGSCSKVEYECVLRLIMEVKCLDHKYKLRHLKELKGDGYPHCYSSTD